MALPDASARAVRCDGLGAQVSLCPNWKDWIAFYEGGWRHDDNSVRQGWNPGPAPVLWSEYAYDGLVTRSEVFAYLEGGGEARRGDEPLYAWIRFSIVEQIEGLRQDANAAFNLLVEKPDATPSMQRGTNLVLGEDTRYPRRLRPSGKTYSRRNGFCLLEKGNRVRIGLAPGQSCKVTHTPPGPDNAVQYAMRAWHCVHVSMENRVGAHVDILLPMVPAERERYAAVARKGYDAALSEVGRFWRRRLKPSVIRVPEPPIDDAIYNSLRFSHMLSERDPATGKLCKVNASWHYNALWATPGAMDLTMLLDTLGYHDRVAGYLEIFRDEQGTTTPPGIDHEWGRTETEEQKGVFSRHPGYLAPPMRYKTIDWLSDNGAILYALAMHGLLSGDKAYIERFAENMVRSCEWIRDARALKGHGGHEGVLPPAVNSDMCTVFQGLWGIGWNYIGLSKAVKLLRRIGHPRAREFEREQRAYRRDFLAVFRDVVSRAPTWTDRSGRKRKVIPPAIHGEDAFRPGHAFALDAGPLFLVFSGLVRATDPAAKDSLAWYREGPPARVLRRESGCWQMGGLVHEMSSCEPCYSWNLFHSLQLGDRDRFLEGLYSLFAGGMSRKTWISVETRGGVAGNVFTAPLPIYLSRLSILDDIFKDDELHLLRVVSPEWLKHPGLSLDKIPTEHGPVSLDASLTKNGKRLDIHYRPAFHAPPRRVVLHVPPIPGLEETRLNGKRVKGSKVEV